jgi:hypothetical protein
VDALKRLFEAMAPLQSAPDLTSRLRDGLSEPEQRRPTLLLLGLLDSAHTVAVVDAVLDAGESHRDALLARELLGRLPRDVLEQRVPSLVLARLDTADDDAYRRLAELLSHLGLRDALATLCVRAAGSDDPEIRDVADDFSGR